MKLIMELPNYYHLLHGDIYVQSACISTWFRDRFLSLSKRLVCDFLCLVDLCCVARGLERVA
jgi:hypothetical protein